MAKRFSRRRLAKMTGGAVVGAHALSKLTSSGVVSAAQTATEALATYSGTGGLTLPFSAEPLQLRGFSTPLYASAPGIKTLADQVFFKEAGARTNISFDWQMAAADATNPIDLVMASGNLPDVFWGISPDQAVDYGQQGALAPLNDLIAENCPNFSALMDEFAELRSQITAPDGNIYFFPRLLLEPETRSFSGFIIRKDWLDEVGLDIPQTTDELYEALQAFKQKDANRYPLTWDPRPLIWAFGSGSQGAAQTNDFSHEAEKVHHAALETGFGEGLAYLNKLYDEGLLDPEWINISSGGGQPEFFKQRWLDEISGVQFGYAGTHLSAYANVLREAGIEAEIAPMLPPAGPNGVRENLSNHNLIDPTQGGSIATSTEHAREIAQYIDYIYSPEGNLLFNWGIEGETFTFVDGVPEFTDKVRENDAKLSAAEYIWNYISPNWFGPMILPKLQYFQTVDPVAREGLELWGTLVSQRKLPVLLFSEDEAKAIRTTMTDINTLMQEKVAGFITSAEPVSGVSDLASTVEGMGIDEAINAYQTAYDRFLTS